MTPNYDRAANMAYRSIVSLKLDRLPIDPLSILMQCNNTAVHTFDDLMRRSGISDPHYFKTIEMSGNDAFTIRREYKSHIVYELFYDSHANKHRMRFTLAHELGHILLNHKMEAPWEEKEADYFASQLLAPRPVFNALSVRGFDTSNAELIALTFNLSRAAAEIAAKTPVFKQESQLFRAVANQFSTYADQFMAT